MSHLFLIMYDKAHSNDNKAKWKVQYKLKCSFMATFVQIGMLKMPSDI